MTSATRTSTDAAAPDEREIALYATMLRLRRFEEKAGMLYALGMLGAPCPLGIGREGAVAGLVAALAAEDDLVAVEASPTLALALGDAPAAVFQSLVPPPGEGSRTPLVRTLKEPPRAMVGLLAPVAASAANLVFIVGSKVGAVATAADAIEGRPVLPVVIVARDAVSDLEVWPLSWRLREIDGTDAAGVMDAVSAARADVWSGGERRALLIVTPPYVGHVRLAGGRAPSRRDVPDPIAWSRRRLLMSGRVSEADLLAMEAAVREEITAAGRALAAACGDGSSA